VAFGVCQEGRPRTQETAKEGEIALMWSALLAHDPEPGHGAAALAMMGILGAAMGLGANWAMKLRNGRNANRSLGCDDCRQLLQRLVDLASDASQRDQQLLDALKNITISQERITVTLDAVSRHIERGTLP
jgi:hypothetical protein